MLALHTRFCSAVFKEFKLVDPRAQAASANDESAADQASDHSPSSSTHGQVAQPAAPQPPSFQPWQAPRFFTHMIPAAICEALQTTTDGDADGGSDGPLSEETKASLLLCAQLCLVFTEIPWSTEYAFYCANHHRALESLASHMVLTQREREREVKRERERGRSRERYTSTHTHFSHSSLFLPLFTLTHSLTHSHTHSLTLSLTPSLSLSHSLTHTHTHTHSLSLATDSEAGLPGCAE